METSHERSQPRSAGYGCENKRFHSAGYACDHKSVGRSGHGNGMVFQSYGYGADSQRLDIHWKTTKISSDKEGQEKLSADLRVGHSSVVLPQPLCLNALPFSGPSKSVGKPHTAWLIFPAHSVCEQKSTAPLSPKVTCFGSVKIKKEGHGTERTHTKKTGGIAQRHGKHKDGTQKGGNKSQTLEKRSCLPRRKRRENTELGISKLPSTMAAPLERGETRRERAALFARTLTSLLEDLHLVNAENAEYVPAVPPPNALLLMRGLDVSDEHVPQSEEEIRTINWDTCTDSSVCTFTLEGIFGIFLQDVDMRKSTKLRAGVENYTNAVAQSMYAKVQKGSLLSRKLETKSLAQNASSFQELALWQRRAIKKLATIDTRRPMREGIKHPNTN